MKKQYNSLGAMLKHGDFKEILADFEKYDQSDWDILSENQHGLPSELDQMILHFPKYIYDENDQHIEGAFDVLNILLQKGANPNAPFKGQMTPFMVACQTKDIKLVKAYIENEYKPADVNLADVGGNRPIWYAVHSESVDIIELLVKEYNVDINKQYILSNNRTVLHYACSEGLSDSVNKLMELNADPTLRDDYDNQAGELIPDFDEEIHNPGDIPEELLEKWNQLFEKIDQYTLNYQKIAPPKKTVF